ncbi:MmgE/PrpD family protein [Burkholderia multivorans]|uniref:MmgE/PrpD family protein n=2 Tax=Burkholderia multivorans TaxID=87883 RepID=UPI00018E3C0B|nr:MmgE/PrpD family protein [Burkholderia multivorans]EED99740.1 MmgE/PrpD family [Burkholderia multivorans CGD1]
MTMKSLKPTTPEQDPAGKLAKMVIHTTYDDIPPAVIELAKKAIFDTLSVIIAGSSWEVSPQIVEQVTEWGGAAQSTILVYGNKVPATLAAFANGVMARAIDMGDVHETGGHVTEWNVPALFAALGLSDKPITGKDFLAAYITASEMSVRVNAAMNGCSHASVGIPGEYNGPLCATASVSRLLGLSVEKTWNALGIAYSVHGMSEMQKYAEGTQMVRVQHSFAGETAIKATLLSRRGVTGPKGIFMGVPGGVYRHLEWDDFDVNVLTDDLGTRWHYAEGLSMKPYSACKYTHSFIASTIELMVQNRLDHRDISSICCVGSEGARMTIEPVDAKWTPKTAGEALFSAPYTIATAAITGDVFLGDFSEREILRADKQELMQKIRVTSGPAITDQFEGFPVEICLRDGRVFRHTTPYVKGHTKNPMTWDDLARKFWKCVPYAAVALPEAKLRKIVELCAGLDEVQDVSDLVDALTP